MHKILHRANKVISIILVLIIVLLNTSVFAFDLTDTKNNRNNIAPAASFSAIVKNKLDVIVITNYKGEKLGKLQSAITDFKAQNLSKYDIRSVVANNLPKMNLGTQGGTYNVGVYGIVGNAPYTADIVDTYDHRRTNYNTTMSVCLNPVWVYPGQTPPSGSAVVPTRTNKVSESYNRLNDNWIFDIYSFTNNLGMDYTYYPCYADTYEHNSDTPGINCGYLRTYSLYKSWYSGEVFGTYNMTPTPSTLKFSFNPNISFFRNETKNCTNTVKALNLTSDDLKARKDSKAFYIIAMDGSSTDFYSTDIYNSDNSINYMLGNLRTDNLGKYIKDSNAVVLADVDSSALDMNLGDVTERTRKETDGVDSNGDPFEYDVKYYANNYNMNFDSTTSLQNLTVNQLLQYGSEGRTYDKNEIDGAGVINRLPYFITEGKNKIDLTVVTDKDTGYANGVSNLVKSSVGSSVDVNTTIIDNSKARKVIGQRTYYNFKDGLKLNNSMLRVGDDYNNTWYNLGALKDEAVTSASVVATNVKDMDTITQSKWPNGYYEEDATINYLITSSGDLYTTEKYFSYKLLSNTERTGYYYKLDRSAINNEQVRSWHPFYYSNVSDSVHAYFGMYIITENNNLYFLYNRDVTLVCSNVYLTTSYTVATNSSGSAVKYVLVGVKKNGEAYQYGYRTPLSKYCAAKSSPISRMVGSHIITEDGTSYKNLKEYLNNTPSSTSYSDWLYVYNKFVIFKDGRFGINVAGEYEPARFQYLPIPQGNPVKISHYLDLKWNGNLNCYNIKLSDNSVLDTDISSDSTSLPSIKETNYTDFLYFDTNYRTYNDSGYERIAGGTYFKVDVNGNVYIDVFDPDYEDREFKEIKLQDDIAQKVVNKSIINVESIDNELIKAAPLREGADKVLIYISDKYRTQVGAGIGTYFPWGGINSDIRSYLENNHYAVYFVTPQQGMSSKFIPPYINNQYYNSLNSLNYANIFDSYRFDSTDQLSAYLSNRYGINNLVEDPNGIYLIQGEDTLSYSIKYDDFEVDPMNALKWRFTHDPAYFENNNGLNPYSGQWQTTFNKAPYQVGKYIIECEAQDNPLNNPLFKNYWLWSDNSGPQTVYVHRRPVADFSIDLSHNGTGFNTNIVDNSYDLDRLSSENRGIVKWKWKYRVKGSTDWVYGKLPSYIDGGQVYEVYLEVLDRQGAWSKSKIVVLDVTSVDLTPTVDANPPYYGWTNQNIQVTVTADDKGENDFYRVTYVSSASTADPRTVDGTMYQKQFQLTYTAEGSWYLHMHVRDKALNKFYRYRGPYLIDKTPPGLTATPYQQSWTNQNVTVDLSPWDALSGVQKWRYVVSDDNGVSWGNWTGYSWGPTLSTVTFDYEGEFKIMSEITDNAGNVSYVVTGAYQIDKTPPVITPDKEGPIEAMDSITVNLTMNDNLSGVKVTRYCFTDSTDTPSDDEWLSSTAPVVAATQTEEGIWFLHVECEDNAGNVSYRVVGSFEVIKVKIYDLTVTLINDIIWKNYYFEETSKGTKFERKEDTDIKAYQMPVNNYNGACIINYGEIGIDSGCEVSFYLRSVGNPENLLVYAHYITSEGEQIAVINPVSSENQLWKYTFIIPLECLEGTYITFDAEAVKKGKRYGAEYWNEPWLPFNTDRKIFYISGNAVDRLKFNQSH